MSVHLRAEDSRGVRLKLVIYSKYRGTKQYSPIFNKLRCQFCHNGCRHIYNMGLFCASTVKKTFEKCTHPVCDVKASLCAKGEVVVSTA